MDSIQKFHQEKEFLNYIVSQECYDFLKKELNKYYQHGHTSIFKHVRNVSFSAYKTALFFHNKFNLDFDYNSMIRAGFMHDLFMYDWHDKNNHHKLHGFSHPKTAAQNAKQFCNATQKEQSIIKTHMWPLTITKIPRSKEAWLICLCDKHVALKETLLR